MARLARLDVEVAAQFDDFRLIIGFRNILAHGYDVIDDETTWNIAHDELPNLVQQVLRMRES